MIAITVSGFLGSKMDFVHKGQINVCQKFITGTTVVVKHYQRIVQIPSLV